MTRSTLYIVLHKCWYVCVYMWMYVCICLYMYVCTYTCIYVCMCIYVDNLSPFDSNMACLCQSIEINNNKHICIYTCIIFHIVRHFICFIDIFNSTYFALLCKSLLMIIIAILITEMNCVFTNHDYFHVKSMMWCYVFSRVG